MKKILKCVWFNCNRLLIDKTHEKYPALKRVKDPKLKLNKVYKVCKDIKAWGKADRKTETYTDGCGQKQPRLRKTGLRIKADFPIDEEDPSTNDNKRDLTAAECLKILGRISPDDCRFLGFDLISAKPEWLIISRLPVAPPPVRPSVSMGSNIRQEDDLTHQYQQILKANNQLSIIFYNHEIIIFY